MPHIDVTLDAVPAYQPTRFELDGFGIVVLRTDDGVFAYEDVCPHAKWRLSAGEIIAGHLECPGHGWEFQISTGRCVTVPTYCLRTVRVETLDEQTVRLLWEQPSTAAVKTESPCAVES